MNEWMNEWMNDTVIYWWSHEIAHKNFDKSRGVMIIIGHYRNSVSPFTYWFSFSYPFLVLRIPCPQSVVSSLHIFVCPSYSFLLGGGYLLSCVSRCKRCQRSRIFMIWNRPKPGIFVFPTRRLPDAGTERIKTHKTRTVPGNPGRVESQLTYHQKRYSEILYSACK
jgi:hypothetical protein